MQNLDVISVNLWQIIISLLNLTIMFLILKKFLFKPVKRMLAERQAAIDGQYEDAKNAREGAEKSRNEWENKLSGAKDEADGIIKSANEKANTRGEEIIAQAKEKAAGIVKKAEMDAELERKKAADDIKKEIAGVSTLLTEKMLEREINQQDHRDLIDSFIENIGDGNDGNK